MNNQPLSQETTINIVKNGTYYCPASKHYNNQSLNVVCDRCRKTNLDMCIGLDTYDLCLSCVQDVSSLCNPTTINPPPVFQGPVLTRMIQDQFRANPGFREPILAMMLQRQFRPNPVPSTSNTTDTETVDAIKECLINSANPCNSCDSEMKTFMMQSSCRKN